MPSSHLWPPQPDKRGVRPLAARRLGELNVRGQRRTSPIPGSGRAWGGRGSGGPRGPCAHARRGRRRRPEEPGSRAAAAGARRRDGRVEIAGSAMWPLESPGSAELQEPGLPLTDDTPPGASEEPAAAETAETPDPGWCWPCRSSPCGSRVQPGECGVQTRARVSPLGGRWAGASAGSPAAAGRGNTEDRALHPHSAQAQEITESVTWGGSKTEVSCTRAGAKSRESF